MARVKVSTGEGYARWAREYDAYPNPLIIAEEPIVRALVGDVANKRVLDVACGTGRHTLWLASQGARVTAVDPSAEMLAVAREKAGSSTSITFLEGEAAALPVADASFDLVVNALLMEHLPHVVPALVDAHRVIAVGGAFVLSVYHPWFVLKGVPTHFASAADEVEYELPAHAHLPSTYVAALIDLDMRVTHFVEPVVDDALIARRPNMEKHRGFPIAIILRAVKS